MMKRLTVFLVLVAMLLSFGACGALPKVADTQDFTLHNDTDAAIYFVYVSPVTSDDWEEDVLEDDVLMPDETYEVTFSGYEGVQYWDLKVEDANEVVGEWENLDLFAIKNIHITMDAAGELKASW